MKVSNLSRGPLAIIGPSGCGKSAVLNILASSNMVAIVPTWTDRPRRLGETDGEHKFVSGAEFDLAVAEERFVEVVRPFGLPYRYGMAAITPAERLRVVMIRAPYAKRFRSHYPDAVIYQIGADFEFAKKNAALRDQYDGTRLEDFESELILGQGLADRVFVNDGGNLVSLAKAIESALLEDGLL